MARPRRTLISRATATALVLVTLLGGRTAVADDVNLDVRFEPSDGRLGILIGGRVFATYVYEDEAITRPYFCNLYAPCAVKVTRAHPAGRLEFQDHPQMHPGLWLAFGDLNGNDSWRLKAPIEHVEFVGEPQGGRRRGTFTVRNRYLSNGGKDAVCDEECHYTILARPQTTTIVWDSTFSPIGDETIVFGDQEEMGLGVRLASSVAEKTNARGLLTNSKGQSTAADVWGQPAEWCDYSGIVEEQPVGITIAAHPQNFRRPWWHARDYGLMLANPFGRAAMKQGETSRVEVSPGESLRLRFSVIVHNARPGEGYSPADAISWEPVDQ